ncbi:hypothetical protein YC2023_015911 [Brassica napus]
MYETSKGIGLDAVGASLNDLAKQGVIEQEKVDSFSTPLYFAEENELKQIIEENGRFTIEAFEDIIHAKGEFTLDPKQVFTKVFDLIEAKLRQELPRLLNAKPGMQYLIQSSAENFQRHKAVVGVPPIFKVVRFALPVFQWGKQPQNQTIWSRYIVGHYGCNYNPRGSLRIQIYINHLKLRLRSILTTQMNQGNSKTHLSINMHRCVHK